VPSALDEVIESSPAIAVNWRSSGLAMLEASVSGSPPGRPAPTLRVGKSIEGRSLTGSAAYASTPNSATASMSRLVAIGRRTNSAEMFTGGKIVVTIFLIIKRILAPCRRNTGRPVPSRGRWSFSASAGRC
jgi:hypothetical protein